MAAALAAPRLHAAKRGRADRSARARAIYPAAGLRVALVGCGQWGQNYLRVLNSIDGCTLVAVSDTDPDRIARAVRTVPGIRTAWDPAQLIDDPEIEAMVIATPPTTHYSLVHAALSAGKDCLVEKPMTVDVREARRLRDLAHDQDRILMVGHVFRYNAGINYVQQALGSGALGSPQVLYFTRTNLGALRSDVNVVWDLVAHDVSILLHLMHELPEWVSAQGGHYVARGGEEVAFVTLGYGNGVIANIRASWLDPRKVRQLTVVGSRKMVVFDDLNPTEPVRIFDKAAIREPDYRSFGEFKMVTHSGDVLIPAIAPSEPLMNQCRQFVQCVANRTRPLSDAEDGLRVVEILTAVNRSIAALGTPMRLRVDGEGE